MVFFSVICLVSPHNRFTYTLQANPSHDRARAEDEGGHAGHNDETVKHLSQVESLSSWKNAQLKMNMLSNFHRFIFCWTLTHSDDFPVLALTDANIMLHVDLYPAAVSLVAERDLSRDYRRTPTKNQSVSLTKAWRCKYVKMDGGKLFICLINL